jgi:predicted DCC family thiol-disulfide oxidoreductase YuxK
LLEDGRLSKGARLRLGLTQLISAFSVDLSFFDMLSKMADINNTTISMPSMTDIELVYDGDCPVCRAYVQMHRLRQSAGNVRLIDARQHPDVVDAYARRGIDLNRDFVLKLDGAEYIGGAAMFALSSIAARHAFIRRLNARVFASNVTSRAIYAVLRVSRWALLLLIGREPIRPSTVKSSTTK